MSDVQDLGVLDSKVLLFGGAYSNLQALQAMLLKSEALGIQPDHVIHTGDVIAYCAQPRETSELLRSSGVRCLMGNCEESVGAGKNDCGCGFAEDSVCGRMSVNWYGHSMAELEAYPELRQWMGGLPRRIEFTIGGQRLAVVHGSPRHISEFLFPSAADAELLACFGHLPPDIDGIICGHSGIPFARLIGDEETSRLWLNAGVIGMPANDGTPRGWFATMEPTERGITVGIHALPFDVESAADAIFGVPNLDRAYAMALRTGVWPSHDVLPIEEFIQTQIPLDEKTLLWPTSRRAVVAGGRTVLVSPVALATLALAVACVGVVAVRTSRLRSH